MKKQFFYASFLSLLVGCSPNGMNPLPQSSLSPRVLNAADRGPVPPDMISISSSACVCATRCACHSFTSSSPSARHALAGRLRRSVRRDTRRVRALRLVAARAGARDRAPVAEPHDGDGRGNALALNQAFGVQMHNFARSQRHVHGVDDADRRRQRGAQRPDGRRRIDNSVKWESHSNSRRSRTPSVLRRRRSSRRATTRPSPRRHSPARGRRSRSCRRMTRR